MDYSKRIVQLFGERCTKESHHHDRGSEPEWCDRCFAYAQHDEIERLRGLFVLVSGFNETPHPCKKEIDDIVEAALQQKDSE